MITAMTSGLLRHPATPGAARPSGRPFPLAEADQCVKCGLCLPHCPTYLESRQEGDSPRGRITLMQGLVSGLVEDTPALQRHLDGCLSCRACEPVCPARVPYGRLIDAGRAQLAERNPKRTRLTRWLGLGLTSAGGRRLMRGLLGVYRGSGLQGLIRRSRVLGSGRWARLESLLPARPHSATDVPLRLPQADGARRRTAAVFAGCVTDVVEREALAAARLLIEACGWQVVDAPGQTCCGALHLHAGLPKPAAALAARNLAAFAGVERVITTASGCAVALRELSAWHDDPGSSAFETRVEDLHRFLAREGAALRFAPLHARVAVHLPCTLTHVLKGAVDLTSLLERVPGVEWLDLDPSGRCCGAAGTYFLTEPEMADRLLAPKLDAVQALAPDWVLSANIGCSLHLAAGLLRRGNSQLRVLHPAVFLARQLRD